MNDQTDPTPTEPIAPVDTSVAQPFPPADAGRHTSGDRPAASYTGRTPRKTAAVRAGMILGTGLLVAIGAAVAMGASPAPSASSGAQTPTMPGFGNGAGPGLEGFGPFGPGGRGEGRGFAAGGRMDGRGFGQISVTAISGSNISLATEDGWKRTIAVTSATTITKGGAAATLADLAVGDTVRFAETRNSDGTWTITAIEIVVPRTAGTVTAVGSDTITITLRDGTSQTFKTTGSTTYHLEQADAKRSDVTVGSSIVASGEKAADGTLTATSVWVRLPHVAGTVTATTSTTITLTRPDGTTMTVHVGSSTTIRVAGVDNAKLSDVKTGMAVVVAGTQRADGSIDATAIGAGTGGFAPGMGRGHGFLPWTDPDASAAPSASSGTEG